MSAFPIRNLHTKFVFYSCQFPWVKGGNVRKKIPGKYVMLYYAFPPQKFKFYRELSLISLKIVKFILKITMYKMITQRRRKIDMTSWRLFYFDIFMFCSKIWVFSNDFWLGKHHQAHACSSIIFNYDILCLMLYEYLILIPYYSKIGYNWRQIFDHISNVVLLS